MIKRLRQSNHVSAYGPGSALQAPPPPVSVSENQPPPGHPPPHPASDLASYMYGVQPQQPQQQHSPHQNKWSPAPTSGSVKEEPKPNMNQQAAAAGDMGGQAPESPQQQEASLRCMQCPRVDMPTYSFRVVSVHESYG